ncbi:MAG: hypothetical protein LBE12_05755 [Planctomycetaceae bacterium]|nr:hypothetical protein [Planctomycetaceae bacterium]
MYKISRNSNVSGIAAYSSSDIQSGRVGSFPCHHTVIFHAGFPRFLRGSFGTPFLRDALLRVQLSTPAANSKAITRYKQKPQSPTTMSPCCNESKHLSKQRGFAGSFILNPVIN